MDNKIKLVCAGINKNKRIWGVISYSSYISDNSRFRRKHYTFWGTYGGCIRFARTYESVIRLKSQPNKFKYKDMDPDEEFIDKIENYFTQHLLVEKLKSIV